jgi:hypothetical protein
MQRKSSVHFKPVTNIKFAVSHSERTELSEPGYLLPKKHQLPNIVVAGSLSETDLAELFIKQKEAMTGQAKARGSSPFWEGVVVLGNTDAQEQSANLLDWKKAYEQTTGHKVLHMSIHLDEGYIDKAGNPEYNPHAHVIVSRMNEKNRIIKLERKELAAIQDLTAETLKMERGSTLKERGGKRGREHIPHNIFREMANGHRVDLEKETNRKNDYANWLDYKNNQYDLEKEKNKEANKIIAEKYEEIERLKLEHKAEVEKLRTELKASGEAKQADYQRLQKLSKEWSDEDFFKIEKLQAQLDREPTRLAAALAAQKAHLDEQYRLEREALETKYKAERVEYKASTEKKTQQDYKDLKAVHLGELDALAKAHASDLAGLESKADLVPDLKAEAVKAQAEIDRLTTQYKLDREEFKRLNAEAAAAGLEKVKSQKDYQDLKVAHEKALAEIDRLTPVAAQVPELESKLATATAAQAAVVTSLMADLAEALKQAATARQERDSAKTTATTEQATVVIGLKADLLEARQLAKDAQQEAINTKLTADERYNNLHSQALKIQAERDKLAAKLATSIAPPAQPAAPAQTPASRHQTPAPALAPALAPRPTPTPAPAVQAPTLAERLHESLKALMDWIKRQSGELKEINAERADCYGAVVQLDDLHAVQRVGRGTYAIHQLDKLDKVPALDDPKTEISYRDGRGQVAGAVQSREKDRR